MLILAYASVSLRAQDRYPNDLRLSPPDTQAVAPQYENQAVTYTQPFGEIETATAATAEVTIHEPGPGNFQTEVVRPIPVAAAYANSSYPGGPTQRLAQVPASPELVRPELPPAPSNVQPGGPSAAEATNPSHGMGSPFDPTQYRLPTLGLPPGLNTPEPTPEVNREFGQFVEREISPQNTIQVVIGRAKVIVLREKPRRIYIPDEAVAGFQIVTDQQFAVVGKKAGRTVLNLWFADPHEPNDPNKDHVLSYMVVVLPDPERAVLDVLEERKRLEAAAKAFEQALKVLSREIKEAFPDSAVQLSLVGDQVVVRGESKDIIEAAQILRIVAAHTPNGRRTKVDSRNVNVAFIPGLGDEEAAVTAIRDILLGSPNIVNLLRVPGEQQVMLMVVVAEVNRDAARTIGMDFSITRGNFAFGQVSGGLLTAASGAVAGGITTLGGNLPTSISNGSILMAIQALRTMDYAKSLAEPNLTTMNGKTASFLAGGSFPLPTSVVTPGGAAQSVSYQNFGVELHFTPYITDRDRIRLVLNASVSTPSTATTQVSGASVPSQITERTFNTTVEMREGQTLTVAGLVQSNVSGQSKRVPLWGDLPLIGRTGGLDSVSSGEQEVVVLVTPVLVHPMDMCRTPNLPGNDLFEPGDVEFYLLGHMEGRRTEDFRASARTDFCRQKAWCDCNDHFIIGPQGPTYGCCKSNNCPCSQPAPVAPSTEAVPAPRPEVPPVPVPAP
jgi:pilus assembly protein CpaC